MTRGDSIGLSGSFDRTVYPLNAVMHLRAGMNKLIQNEMLSFEIFDFRKNKLFSKRINPKNKKYRVAPDVLLFEATTKMKGNKWKIGEQYTLRVTYGKHQYESHTIIAKRNSIILTDRETYLLGSDAIITVIAPDFDLDNDKPEFIGNKPNNKITISSSVAKLKNYKLRETGDSTGIFQGVIGFLPPKYIKGKRQFPKPKGKGPADGYLPAKISDETTIKFENQYESIIKKFNLSNFGVAVELDKKTYDCNDKVYMVVVAPDFNFDSEKIDKIGNNEDCKISVSTKIDKITSFELKETRTDSGIFSGEIQLKEVKSSKKGFKKSLKNRKKLLCSENDNLLIQVKLETLTVEGLSKIKKFSKPQLIQ